MSKRKVSVEDKTYAVNLYLDGKESQRRIADMFDVSLASVQQWIRNYESMGVALYMVADMGIAPYDSVATIIEKLTHQKIPFHKARITIHQFLQGSYPERIRAFLFHQ